LPHPVQDVDGITPLHLVYRFGRDGVEEVFITKQFFS